MSMKYNPIEVLDALSKEIKTNWPDINELSCAIEILTRKDTYIVRLVWYTVLGAQNVECSVSKKLINHHPHIFFFIAQQLNYKLKSHVPIKITVLSDAYKYEPLQGEDF